MSTPEKIAAERIRSEVQSHLHGAGIIPATSVIEQIIREVYAQGPRDAGVLEKIKELARKCQAFHSGHCGAITEILALAESALSRPQVGAIEFGMGKAAPQLRNTETEGER